MHCLSLDDQALATSYNTPEVREEETCHCVLRAKGECQVLTDGDKMRQLDRSFDSDQEAVCPVVHDPRVNFVRARDLISEGDCCPVTKQALY